MELVKQPGRTLGFSIAGGRGSTPAYEDVDEVAYYYSAWHSEIQCLQFMCHINDAMLV